MHCSVCDSARTERTPSLMVREAPDGKPLVRCFNVTCNGQDTVVAELKRRGLWPSGNGSRPPAEGRTSTGGQAASVRPLAWWSEHCGVPEELVRTLPLAEEGDRLVFVFGDLPVRKVRRAGTKELTWEPPGAEVPPLWPLPGPELPETIYLTEGESDAVVLRFCGL